MWFSKKPITFVKTASILTRNQRSLFKLVRNILIAGKYDVMYARPAYHLFDVDERTNSKSKIRKGREIVGNAYLDIIVVENETLKAVCAFRMDKNGDKKASEWSKETRELVAAAESAKFPLFIVPDTKTYSSSSLRDRISKVIPVSKLSSSQIPNAEITQQPEAEVKEKNIEVHRREPKVFHKTKP